MRSNNATKRIMKEMKAMAREESNDVILTRDDDNDLLHWKAWILGPPDSPFEGAYFQLSIDIPTSYPLNPPVVKFLTPVFHPNILYKVRVGLLC
jgi:ubiquitin-protein ligase